MDRGIYFAPSAKISPIDQSHSTQAMLSLELGGIKDRGTKRADFLGNQIDEERVFARIYSINNFDKSWRFSFQTNPQSDSEIYRDYITFAINEKITLMHVSMKETISYCLL